MRTTLYLPDSLLRSAKQAALSEGHTFTKFAEEALREALLRRTTNRKRKKVQLPVSPQTGGVYSHINLDKAADLLELDSGFDR